MEESLAVARRLVEAGYSHSFCTPHIWPNLPDNTIEGIAGRVVALQDELDRAGIPLRVIPGGELNLRPDIIDTPPDQIPTYGMARRYCLFDIWVTVSPTSSGKPWIGCNRSS